MALANVASSVLDGSDRDRLALLIVLIGLVLLAHPLYLWAHYGQTQVGLAVEPVSDPPSSAIEYAELPPAAQDAFRASLAGESVDLWTGEDDRALDAFDEQQGRVRYQGEYYQVVLFYSHPGSFVPVFGRWLLTASSALLVAYGTLVRYRRSWRPFTPIGALWVPAAVGAGFVATAAYDVAFSGAAGSVITLSGRGPGVELLQLIAITSPFVSVGSEVALTGRRSRPAIVGAVAILALATLRFNPALAPIPALILTAYTAIGGIAWGAIGYRFTDAA